MLHLLLRWLLLAPILALPWVAAASAAPAGASAAAALCHIATASVERETGIPDQLLTAISRVETGQYDPASGRMLAWPWSIDVDGVGHAYATKAQAIAATLDFQAQGARSIDVGCLQINLRQHPDAFADLDQAFDPLTNARYAARFLERLFQQTGSWPHAAAAYHSQTPTLGQDYQAQVLRIWAEGDGPVRPAGSDERGFPTSGGAAVVPVADAAVARGRADAASPLRAFPATGLASSPPDEAGAAGTVAASGTRPFSGGIPVHIQFYGPAVSRLPPGSNRGLAAYRRMPIAMENRPLYASGG